MPIYYKSGSSPRWAKKRGCVTYNTGINIPWWHLGRIIIWVGYNDLNNMNCIVPNSDKNSAEGSTQNVYARIRKFVAILRLVHFCTVRAQCIWSQISEIKWNNSNNSVGWIYPSPTNTFKQYHTTVCFVYSALDPAINIPYPV